MVSRLFHAVTLALSLLGCAVLLCEAQFSVSLSRLECPDMRQYANHYRSDCAHDVDCRRKGPGFDPNMKCCPTGKSNTHLCVVPITTFNSSVTESQPQTRRATPNAETCNLRCRNGLACRVIDDQAQCVPLLTCASLSCATGSTCIEQKGKDATCVPLTKPEGCNLRCRNGLVCRITDGEAQCVPPVTCAAILCLTGSTCIEEKGRDAICVPQNKPGACNLRCRNGLVCRVIDNQAQCVPLLTCASILCITGTTCIEEKERDAICVAQNKPGTCPVASRRPCFPDRDNTTDQCSDDAGCADDQKCCGDVCRNLCKTPFNPCAVVRCGFDTTCIVVDGRASCQPRFRPGQCPVIIIGCTVLPVRNCEDDSVCASGEKCCLDKCGLINCTAAQPVCTSSSCSTAAGPFVCVEVTTTSPTNVSPKCTAPSSTNDYCTGRSNACKAGQTCLVTRRCFDQLNEVCFPAVTCSDQTNQNPCDSTVCGPNQQCVVLESFPPQARCVDNSPGTKPGQCPTLPPGTVGTCIARCENDNNCAGDHKCCSNGCGKTCQPPANNPPAEPKPGTCPVASKRPCYAYENSTDQCSDDVGCADDQKCCGDVCRNECKTPFNPCSLALCNVGFACVVVNGGASCEPLVRPGQCPNILSCPSDPRPRSCEDDSVCAVGEKCCSNCGKTCQAVANKPPPTPKPGICPEQSSMRPCWLNKYSSDQCFDDANCAGDQKCCDDVCRKECKTPITPCALVFSPIGFTCEVIDGRASCEPIVRPPPTPKPGQCPKLPPGTNGPCVELCQNDYNCTKDQKCCFNGCGHTCQEPKRATKSGQCPTLLPGTMGTCVEACTSDFSCTGDSKCCSNGCGHVCKAPALTCNLLCPSGHRCQLVQLPCSAYQLKNCPTSQPVCVPIFDLTTPTPPTTNTPAEPTCAGVVCPYGQCCQLQTIFCIRAPCPPPFPSCVDCQSTSTSTPDTSTRKPSTGWSSKPYQASPVGPSSPIVTIEDEALNDNDYSSALFSPTQSNTQQTSDNVQSSDEEQSGKGSGGYSGSGSSNSVQSLYGQQSNRGSDSSSGSYTDEDIEIFAESRRSPTGRRENGRQRVIPPTGGGRQCVLGKGR